MQVQVAEAKRDLSKLIRLLESGKEDSITVARNGKPIIRMVYIHDTPVSNRIGIAEGKFRAPDDFDANNEEIYGMRLFGHDSAFISSVRKVDFSYADRPPVLIGIYRSDPDVFR